MSRVVKEAGAAATDVAAEEGHSQRLVMGDALQGTDEIGSFEVLLRVSLPIEQAHSSSAYL
jgi:hypothetical protein